MRVMIQPLRLDASKWYSIKVSKCSGSETGRRSEWCDPNTVGNGRSTFLKFPRRSTDRIGDIFYTPFMRVNRKWILVATTAVVSKLSQPLVVGRRFAIMVMQHRIALRHGVAYESVRVFRHPVLTNQIVTFCPYDISNNRSGFEVANH
jgi:hypothetical protein